MISSESPTSFGEMWKAWVKGRMEAMHCMYRGAETTYAQANHDNEMPGGRNDLEASTLEKRSTSGNRQTSFAIK